MGWRTTSTHRFPTTRHRRPQTPSRGPFRRSTCTTRRPSLRRCGAYVRGVLRWKAGRQIHLEQSGCAGGTLAVINFLLQRTYSTLFVSVVFIIKKMVLVDDIL